MLLSMITLERNSCKTWIMDMLQAAGVSHKAAAHGAEIFIRASLRQTGHHDLTYLPYRLELLEKGTINPQGKMEKLDETMGFSRWEGHGALGEYCCSYLLDYTMAKAKETGVAMGTVRHSNHFLAGHPYGQIAGENGCMALVWSNTDPCMGDPSSEAKVIGNNPLGFGVPGATHPMVLDMCMAYTSLGNLRDSIAQEKRVPEFWGRNSRNEYTTDPEEILNGGVCAPMGEHKGFGLALMSEMLTSGLSLGEMGPQVQPVGGWQTHSQTILVVDLEITRSDSNWSDRMGSLRKDMSERLTNPLRMPGDHLYEQIGKNENSIIIPGDTLEKLTSYCSARSISLPY